MPEVPQTDWNLIHGWEWFRRTEWRHDFRDAVRGQGGGVSRAFCDLAKLIGAEVALDSACGLGQKSICMSEMGLNVIGSDASDFAVEHARQLAELEGAHANFFTSTWAKLPQTMPHRFDAVFNDTLHTLPTWDALGAALVGHCHAIKPGGFLMFLGTVEEMDPEEERWRQRDEWDHQPHEFADWTYRDGALSCTRVIQKKKGDDYIDDRYLYVISENGLPRLESTVLRRPAYWTWSHWQDIVKTAGFCHLESRTYERYGLDGGPLLVNVAWKLSEGPSPRDLKGQHSAYLD